MHYILVKKVYMKVRWPLYWVLCGEVGTRWECWWCVQSSTPLEYHELVLSHWKDRNREKFTIIHVRKKFQFFHWQWTTFYFTSVENHNIQQQKIQLSEKKFSSFHNNQKNIKKQINQTDTQLKSHFYFFNKFLKIVIRAKYQ